MRWAGVAVHRPWRVWLGISMVVSAVTVLLMMRNAPAWWGVADQNLAALTQTASLTHPIAGAFGAWVAARNTSAAWRAAEELSSRPAWRRRLPSLGFALTAPLGGVVVCVAVLAVAGLDAAAWSRAPVNSVLALVWLNLTGVASWAAVGAWLGARRGMVVGTLLAACLPYALIVGLTSSVTPGIESVLLPIEARDIKSVVVSPVGWWASGAVWMFIGATASASYLGLSRARGALAMACSASAAAAFLVAQPMPVAARVIPTCAGEAPVVCVDAARVAVLPQFQASVDQAVEQLPDALRPARVITAAVASTGETGLVVDPIDGVNGAAYTIDETQFRILFGESALSVNCPPTPSEPEPAQPLRLALAVWWRLINGVAPSQPLLPGTPPLSDLAEYPRALSLAEQLVAAEAPARDAWFREVGPHLAQCRWARVSEPPK
ncbi:MAG TPA: hypothetical protein PLN51_10740 [Ornithinibacter sp.]|jgi:hypothetical protein|nr:hypothetical protein [Ornithinibacter sp.]